MVFEAFVALPSIAVHFHKCSLAGTASTSAKLLNTVFTRQEGNCRGVIAVVSWSRRETVRKNDQLMLQDIVSAASTIAIMTKKLQSQLEKIEMSR
jgi:hypothetical protein